MLCLVHDSEAAIGQAIVSLCSGRPMRSRIALVFALACLSLPFVAACEDGEEQVADTTATDTSSDTNTGDSGVDMEIVASSPGEAAYLSPRADGNSFACATCHSLVEPAPDGFRRVGHPIGGAGQRGAWKNGGVASLRAAVDSCLVECMSAEPFAIASA